MMMRDEDDAFGTSTRGVHPDIRAALQRHYENAGIDIPAPTQRENAMYDTMTPLPVVNKRVKPWMIVAAAIGALVMLCLIVGLLVGPPKDKTPAQVLPIATASRAPAQGIGAAPTSATKPASVTPTKAAPVAPKTVTVAGKNNSAVPIGAVLNGAFTVNYSFGSWCGIAEFVKADGSDGAKFMEDINDCADDMGSKLTGSTIVHLTNVTMVKVDNTRGEWLLTFTPLG